MVCLLIMLIWKCISILMFISPVTGKCGRSKWVDFVWKRIETINMIVTRTATFHLHYLCARNTHTSTILVCQKVSHCFCCRYYFTHGWRCITQWMGTEQWCRSNAWPFIFWQEFPTVKVHKCRRFPVAQGLNHMATYSSASIFRDAGEFLKLHSRTGLVPYNTNERLVIPALAFDCIRSI